MAKKKKQETQEEVVMETTLAETVVEVDPTEQNGKGVGVYYDSSLRKYVLVTLDLYPNLGTANIIEKKVLKSSKIAAILEADVKLKQTIEKEIK